MVQSYKQSHDTPRVCAGDLQAPQIKQTCQSWGSFSLRVQVPKIVVLAFIVQVLDVLGKYMIIRYLDP